MVEERRQERATSPGLCAKPRATAACDTLLAAGPFMPGISVPHHSLSKGMQPSMPLFRSYNSIMHFVTYICIYTSWFSMSLNISYKYDSSQSHNVWAFHLPVVRTRGSQLWKCTCCLRKSCWETFVFPADYIRTRRADPFCPLLHVPSGRHRSGASSSPTASQDATIFKILWICLTTRDTCFLAEVWSVGRQARGLNPGPCACWTSALSLRSSPNLGHLIKIPLSLLSRLPIMSPLLTAMWRSAFSRHKPFLGLLHLSFLYYHT